MNRRTLVVGLGAILLVPRPSLVFADTGYLRWTSGGDDPSGYSHDEAFAEFYRLGIFKDQFEARKYLQLANADGGMGRGYSTDPIEPGQVFDCMCFGGKKSPKKLKQNVVADPSSWKKDAPREMRTWIWEAVVDGKRVTQAYAVPLVCGNSSAIAYRSGAPVCVPIPRDAPKV